MDLSRRKTVFDDLRKYSYSAKDDDFIEITEWRNGEGIDVTISDNNMFALSYEELDAINYLSKALTCESFDKKQ